MQSDPELKKGYTDFTNEFRSMKHMEEVPEEKTNKPCNEVNYVQCVQGGLNLSVVFDAYAKTSNGASSMDLKILPLQVIKCWFSHKIFVNGPPMTIN